MLERSPVRTVRTRPAVAAVRRLDRQHAEAYTWFMQLRVARLCLDCNEVHDEQHCPACASEAFGYLSRWVPIPERRMRARPDTSPEAEIYRRLTTGENAHSGQRRWWKRGAVGLTALGLAGWAWRWSRDHRTRSPEGSVAAEDQLTSRDA
jgi:hypothetical protein